MNSRRSVLVLIGSALVLGAAFTLLWSAATTSTAQLTASTSGSGSFSAGTVELNQPDTTVALLFDADGLYPGRVVASCVTVSYDGSVPADVRLHASWSGGTGLEEHVQLRLDLADSGSCPDDEGSSGADDGGGAGSDGPIEAEVPADGGPEANIPNPSLTVAGAEPEVGAVRRGRSVFVGLLGDLWRAHPDYDAGLVLVEGAEQGDRLVLDAEVEMIGGDEAQGLTTQFAIIIEARP